MAALPEGIYEHLLTHTLRARIEASPPGLTADLAPVEDVDLPGLLAHHVAQEIERALRALGSADRAQRALEIVDGLPRNPAGKVLKTELRLRYGGP